RQRAILDRDVPRAPRGPPSTRRISTVRIRCRARPREPPDAPAASPGEAVGGSSNPVARAVATLRPRAHHRASLAGWLAAPAPAVAEQSRRHPGAGSPPPGAAPRWVRRVRSELPPAAPASRKGRDLECPLCGRFLFRATPQTTAGHFQAAAAAWGLL